ncbi:MAG TPA: large conductance mechanosensitive channel protein MscL [Acidimicrobiales bacterium]|nr:large conductance mechanosensitive channel protein MscL [Acidimicrobiales bacterium]
MGPIEHTAEVDAVPGVLKEFKEFISRGNVVGLAVAVVIGAAFTAVVTSIVAGLITPLIGMFVGREFRAMDFTINGSTFEYGIVINAVIYFLAVAAVVFFLIVKPLNVLNERRKRGQEEVPPESLSDEAALLVEIRDLLAAQARPGGGDAERGSGRGPGRSASAPPPPATGG